MTEENLYKMKKAEDLLNEVLADPSMDKIDIDDFVYSSLILINEVLHSSNANPVSHKKGKAKCR